MMLATTTLETGGSDWLPGAVMAAGVLALTIASLRVWLRNRRRAQARSEGSSPRERINELSLAKQRDSIESLIVDLQESARSYAAQVENRAARLETLMRQTDARIAELKEAISHADRCARTVTTRSVEPASQDAISANGLRLENARDERNARIIKLHREGNNAADIARSLNEEVGRVELILSLNGLTASPSNASA